MTYVLLVLPASIAGRLKHSLIGQNSPKTMREYVRLVCADMYHSLIFREHGKPIMSNRCLMLNLHYLIILEYGCYDVIIVVFVTGVTKVGHNCHFRRMLEAHNDT